MIRTTAAKNDWPRNSGTRTQRQSERESERELKLADNAYSASVPLPLLPLSLPFVPLAGALTLRCFTGLAS